ncbi:MAG: hypothetical protein KGZ45_02090 [Clostridium sp.]|nr:hypothetical protein [Clostridium sp.]
MKRQASFLLFLLLFWTGTATGQLLALSPAEMVESAQFILAGQVIEMRKQQENPEFVIRVDTVYRGELGLATLTVPLPPQADKLLAVPELESRMLFFLAANEGRRLAPAGSLNWAAFLKDGQAERLFMGARFNNWAETDYLQEYNRFLAETPGRKIPLDVNAEEGAAGEPARRPGEVNPVWFFALAGIMFILLLVLALLKKRR